jgi:DNA-binding NtrC family response regulator
MGMVHFISPKTRKQVMELSQNDAQHVLILGESGTGKSAIARWIHEHSSRSLKPFVLAKPQDDLFQLFQQAQGGAVYFSEIAQWPQGTQKKLAQYLKTHALPNPAQPQVPSLFQVRVLAASDESLENRVKGGLFHADLFAALSKNVLAMPSLTDRMDEFEEIAQGLLAEIDAEATISETAKTSLRSYAWPGNLRELRNVLRFALLHAIARGSEKQIDAIDFPELSQLKAQFKASRESFEKWLSSQGTPKLD